MAQSVWARDAGLGFPETNCKTPFLYAVISKLRVVNHHLQVGKCIGREVRVIYPIPYFLVKVYVQVT